MNFLTAMQKLQSGEFKAVRNSWWHKQNRFIKFENDKFIAFDLGKDKEGILREFVHPGFWLDFDDLNSKNWEGFN